MDLNREDIQMERPLLGVRRVMLQLKNEKSLIVALYECVQSLSTSKLRRRKV